MAVKLVDIANKADVSISTVSLALNNKDGVSDVKRDEILRIAEEMGYPIKDFDEEERAIRFAIYKRHGNVVSDTPFFAKLIEGVQRQCRLNKYDLSISHISHDEDDLEDIIKNINNDKSKGLLLLATEMLEDDLNYFSNLKKPLIILDSYFKHQENDYVLINNTEAASKATLHLIENGHQEIGYLHSSIYINNFWYRKRGFEEALRERNIKYNKDYLFEMKPTMEGAYQDMKSILNSGNVKLPTAFFADNDIIAFGAIRALKEYGMKIPEDISVIGFDDMPFCEISDPRLSTVKVFKVEMGRLAVKRLIEKIDKVDCIRQKIEVGTELVIRDSVVISSSD